MVDEESQGSKPAPKQVSHEKPLHVSDACRLRSLVPGLLSEIVSLLNPVLSESGCARAMAPRE